MGDIELAGRCTLKILGVWVGAALFAALVLALAGLVWLAYTRGRR